MSVGRGIWFGLFGAVAGLAFWLTLSWLTGMTLLILAIVAAGFVGAGVGIGNKGQGGQTAGFVAGTIAICAALVGRFYAIQFAFMAEAKEHAANVGAAEVIEYFAEHARASGRTVEMDDEEGDSALAIAESQWARLSEEDQQEYIASIRQEQMEEAGRMDFGVGLLLSVLTLRIFDFVCIGLSGSSAYATASRRIKDGISDNTADLKPGQTMVLEESASSIAGPFARLGREEKDRHAA